MTLTATPYTNNPFQPGVSQDAFIPDQLIGGDMKIATDTVTITGGAAYVRGSVLGQITLGAATSVATVGNTGNGTITIPVPGVKARLGAYTVKMKSPTTFDVIDPNGVQIAEGFALGAYADAQLGFTIAAGSTPFIAGDGFTITLAAGSGSYKLAAAAATDGSQTPSAILVDNVDTTSADALGGIYLMGEFNANAVTLGVGMTLAAAKAALQMQNIYLKTPISASDPT